MDITWSKGALAVHRAPIVSIERALGDGAGERSPSDLLTRIQAPADLVATPSTTVSWIADTGRPTRGGMNRSARQTKASASGDSAGKRSTFGSELVVR